jgi:hypothetical protein
VSLLWMAEPGSLRARAFSRLPHAYFPFLCRGLKYKYSLFVSWCFINGACLCSTPLHLLWRPSVHRVDGLYDKTSRFWMGYAYVRGYNLFEGIPRILDCVEKKRNFQWGKVIKWRKTGTVVKNSVFRNVMLYGLAEVYWHIKRTYCRHLQV